jgi:hypothetical protein
MVNKFYTSAINWFKTSAVFKRPFKLLPGHWQLVEYFIEPGDELIHIQEHELKEKKQIWNIDFTTDNKYFHECNLNVALLLDITNGHWKTSRNFIVFTSSEKQGGFVEFQFAINNEQLKLLKKDAKGRIEFFGFFNRIA